MSSLTPEVMELYAAIGRGEVVQYADLDTGDWTDWDCSGRLGHGHFRWRIKPRTVTITYPAPKREVGEPDVAGVYGWYVHIEGLPLFCKTKTAAKDLAAAGNLFHTKEDAEAASLARREAK